MSEQYDFFISAPTITIQDSIPRTERALSLANDVVCSVSGGRDSDIMLDMVRRLDANGKVKYVFFDTGLEMLATKKHIAFLQEKYGIKIDTIKPKMSVAYAVRKHGYPFMSKIFAEFIGRLQTHGFKWEDRPFEELYKEYPNCKSALQWWCNCKKDGEHEYLQTEIGSRPFLKEFMMQNPPTFPISPKCCYFGKKEPSKRASATADLVLIGLRKMEGGARAEKIKSCFVERNGKKTHYPCFWFDETDRKEYERTYGVTNSDAYTVYGCKRTGCAGCPFSMNFESELKMLEQYEPKMAKAVKNIFAPSYEYTRAYLKFRDEQRKAS